MNGERLIGYRLQHFYLVAEQVGLEGAFLCGIEKDRDHGVSATAIDAGDYTIAEALARLGDEWVTQLIERWRYRGNPKNFTAAV